MTASALPVGWRAAGLGELATIVMGQAPPGNTVFDLNNNHRAAVEGLPFVQGNAEFGYKFPVPIRWCAVPAKVAEPGDTLISVRAPVGALNRANQRLGIGRGLAAVRFTGLQPRFGWHVFAWASAAFERVAQGSTFDAINSSDLAKLPILVPSRREQVSIAETLDAIDDAIEQTKAVIEATGRLRQALLHELLTRGVPGWHSEWKQVPGIGTIPACWEVARLDAVAYVQTGRAVGKFVSGERLQILPYLSVANVKDGYLDLSAVKTMAVSAGEISRFSLKPGDVLFTEGGDADKLGRGCVWKGEIVPCLHQNHVFAVRPSPNVLRPDFLAAYARSGPGKTYFLSCAKQTTNLASINSTQLKEFRLPLPPLAEQDKILSILNSVPSTGNYMTALRVLKATSADALLSGRVRAGVSNREPKPVG